ncbi:RbsD/FucU domain-containing protein [Rudaeicoccus suwonensis]|uniref:D-ribose pyranase n=1 Tax=Rudaeicoccus suwonensis TaxID=657409 RepID=A0A561E0Y0_9MICO|nr:RbsD/FucU domain-containing protein [Rudaeicoccus suwonensis]TWE09296.1 D-ribose pyranase [Rudaeicoccus suwonensis]
MIRTGVVHAELARHLAGLRHTEHFVVCDSGLPFADVPCVDLGYRYGAASFADVVSTVIPAVVIEASWISEQMPQLNPDNLAVLYDVGLTPESIDHDEFKARALTAKFAVRTGEATFYANVICRAGVPFDSP